MQIILMYILNVIPYILITFPVYAIVRLFYIKNNMKGYYKTGHEIGLAILYIFITSIISQTILPEFEFINGKLKIIENIDTYRFNFVPFKILYQTYYEVVNYSNMAYFYISFLSNILIFIPIGFLLPLLYDKYERFKSTVLIGLSFSTLIELIQIFLPRATDIDDIILNTTGIIIGYAIFSIFKIMLRGYICKLKAVNILDVIKEENNVSNAKDKKYALVTGASSGIGYEMACMLSNLGFNVIAISRSKNNLNKLKKECKTNVEVIPLDLSVVENVYKLYEKTKEKNIEVVVNNAGFGVFGKFNDTNLENELNMIDLNIKCLHILTKLYLKEMLNKNNGYILNVSSSAAFMPAGPLMGTYYSTKSYVLTLTNSINEEIKRQRKNITISSLCLGPTATNFNKNANIHASVNELDARYVANDAIEGLFKKKRVIIPGISNKLLKIFIRFIPDNLLIKLNYNIQSKKDR